MARCVEATCEWSRRWREWVAILKMDPLDYAGKPYVGRLCKSFNLGQDPKRPHAGAGSQFRKTWVEVNGAQPTNAETTLAVFVGRIFEIEVSTVRMNREQKPIAPRAAILNDSQCHSEYNFTTQQPTNPPTHYAPTSPRMWGLRLKGSLVNEFAGSTAAAAGVESRSNLVGCQLRNRQLGKLRKGW